MAGNASGEWATDRKTFMTSLYKPRGTAYARPWDWSAFNVGTPIGTAELRFSDADLMTLTARQGLDSLRDEVQHSLRGRSRYAVR